MLNDSYTKQRNVNTKTGRNWAIKQLRQSQLYLRSAIVLEARCAGGIAMLVGYVLYFIFICL